MAVFRVRLGQELHIVGQPLEEALQQGMAQGYREGYLRKSVVRDPVFHRENTGDNTPAVIYYEMVPGDRLELFFAPKGFGSENMSTIKMLKPADGEKGVREFILSAVEKAGPNPCPPIIVGVGIGGTFDKCAQLSKFALMRPVGSRHPDPAYAAMERELLDEINRMDIGPAGLGGRTTALAVHIETYPTHIAGTAGGGEPLLPRLSSRPCGAVKEGEHEAYPIAADGSGHCGLAGGGRGAAQRPAVYGTGCRPSAAVPLLAGGEASAGGTGGGDRLLCGALSGEAGAVIGSAGPTTSYRMDPYTPPLLALGLKGMIGKGRRSGEVVQAVREHGAVYFITIGGAAALLAEAVKKKTPVCYEDLGPEAICRLEVEDFYAIVGIDSRGNTIIR